MVASKVFAVTCQGVRVPTRLEPNPFTGQLFPAICEYWFISTNVGTYNTQREEIFLCERRVKESEGPLGIGYPLLMILGESKPGVVPGSGRLQHLEFTGPSPNQHQLGPMS